MLLSLLILLQHLPGTIKASFMFSEGFWVRLHIILASLILFGLLLSASGADATCTPKPGAVVCLSASDDTCSQVGATTMDGDQKNLIACLYDDSHTLRWKAMSSGPNDGPPGYLCGAYFAPFGSAQIDVPCKGSSVLYGCPSGYSSAVIGFGTTGINAVWANSTDAFPSTWVPSNSSVYSCVKQ
jgi:hypothetical protein